MEYVDYQMAIVAISQRETMDTEICQTSLKEMLERISRLEQDVRELRQSLQVHPSHLQRSGNVPASLSTHSLVSRSGSFCTGDWEIRCLGSFHFRCAGREVQIGRAHV